MQCKQFANIHHLWDDFKNIWSSPFQSEKERERERVREKSSQTHFSDRILNYVLMNTTASDFVLHAADSIFWNFRLRFGFRTLRTANAQRSIYSLVSIRFFSALPCDVSFSIHLLILNFCVCFLFRLLSTTVFSLLKFLTVYFFGFSHQRAHFRCSIDSVRNCSVFHVFHVFLSISFSPDCFAMHWNVPCCCCSVSSISRFRYSDLNRKIVIFNISTDPSQPIRLDVWTHCEHTIIYIIYSNFYVIFPMFHLMHTSHRKPYGLDLVQSRNFSIFCLNFEFWHRNGPCACEISIFFLPFIYPRAKIPMCISTEHRSVFTFRWWCGNVCSA